VLGCPVKPESVLDALRVLAEKIANG